MSSFPTTRLRRLRRTEAMRTLVAETVVRQQDLVYPIFVEEEISERAPVASMPGVFRYSEGELTNFVKSLSANGVRSLMVFGVSHNKDASGSDSWRKDGLLSRMIKRIKDADPNMIVISDNCFCEYTDHGHCGVVKSDRVDNDETLDNLTSQAIVCAESGADIIAPSAMMDGQVQAIRKGLDSAGHQDIPIMSYSTKFASSMYGPFRAAAGSELKGDRKTYQMDTRNRREALRESLLDEMEGADILLVKPALPSLDIIASVRDNSLLPLAAYQVSGEYSMIKCAAAAGMIDEMKVVPEMLYAIKRSGADIILTYFANEYNKYFEQESKL